VADVSIRKQKIDYSKSITKQIQRDELKRIKQVVAAAVYPSHRNQNQRLSHDCFKCHLVAQGYFFIGIWTQILAPKILVAN